MNGRTGAIRVEVWGLNWKDTKTFVLRHKSCVLTMNWFWSCESVGMILQQRQSAQGQIHFQMEKELHSVCVWVGERKVYIFVGLNRERERERCDMRFSIWVSVSFFHLNRTFSEEWICDQWSLGTDSTRPRMIPGWVASTEEGRIERFPLETSLSLSLVEGESPRFPTKSNQIIEAEQIKNKKQVWIRFVYSIIFLFV